MNITKLVIPLTVISLFLFSCAGTQKSRRTPGVIDCSEKLEDAIEAYQRGNHGEVIRVLDDVRYQCGGSPIMDSVHYYLGMSYFNRRQPLDARTEFEYLLREYPYSQFAPKALYRMGYLVYRESNPPDRDQRETMEAINLFNQFLDTYPRNEFADSAQYYLDAAVEKLAEKEYKNARFYSRQGKNEAALVYYNSLISKFSSSSFATKGIIEMAEIYYDAGRKSEAAEVLNKLEGREMDESMKKRSSTLKSRLEN
ncbi:outer membrane protein assembly factor BamD [Chitinispirillales bacterium ANBcel5]|uniref:outer membrane protein assembly factor BamD n=1 Tax=Cellulosispirillum alkaliphilum TaxID=3039283 RepID=UPI002A504B34|nr:outer membrane protein assembly factor BamD [Chitinispirillales bacterium ANBcel5]